MIRGRVDLDLQVIVPIEVRGKDGIVRSIEAVLDTGFDGCLSLPGDLIDQLGWESDLPVNVKLANGGEVLWDTWDGYVVWHGRLLNALIFEVNETPLLGMELLEDSQLNIQVLPGGNVLIEEM